MYIHVIVNAPKNRTLGDLFSIGAAQHPESRSSAHLQKRQRHESAMLRKISAPCILDLEAVTPRYI